jgi:hypothetical protein
LSAGVSVGAGAGGSVTGGFLAATGFFAGLVLGAASARVGSKASNARVFTVVRRTSIDVLPKMT